MQSGSKVTFDINIVTTGLACLKYAEAVLIDNIGSFDIKKFTQICFGRYF